MGENEYVNEILFNYGYEVIKASLCMYRFSGISSYKNIEKCINLSEEEAYKSIKNKDKIKNHLIGMYAAKKAISELIHKEDVKKIIVGKGIFNQPIVIMPDNYNAQVTITHCLGYGIAVATPQGYPVGIDLENINAMSSRVAESQLTEHEKRILYSYNLNPVLLWTIKESLSKILMTGISTPFKIYEVDELNISSKCIVSYFKNFLQYKGVSIISNKYIFSLVYPKKFELQFDIESFRNILDEN